MKRISCIELENYVDDYGFSCVGAGWYECAEGHLWHISDLETMLESQE